MKQVFKLFRFIKPYWKKSVISLVLLTAVVIMDLAIPRLVQRVIDQGINRAEHAGGCKYLFPDAGHFVLDTIFAVGNNNFSVQVGKGLARDLREAIFVKIQSFSFGNLGSIEDRPVNGTTFKRLRGGAASVSDIPCASVPALRS